MDQSLAGAPADELVYPFPDTPATGTVTDIMPGVRWLRMPLPFVLNHINLYLLEDGDGWTLIDTGVNAKPCREVWTKVFAEDLRNKPIHRIIVTHMHPDHVGLAGWIGEKFDAPLWMSRTDYLMCRMLVNDKPGDVPQVATDFYRRAGFRESDIEDYLDKFGRFGMGVHNMPASYRRIIEGETIRIGDNDWNVIVGSGHAPEHVCLHCEKLNLFISGDQVLPRISSIVSVFPTQPEANPLRDWLDSCAKLKRQLPPEPMVLPAHNLPFYGLHKRLDQLIAHHETGLRALYEWCAEPRRAVDVFPPLFGREITPNLMLMAVGESLAHLHCLMSRGLIARERGSDGVDRYRQKK
jgi:glyoxylase-like metal-dependent hydrolase (beta-lactamase superfamily II)